MPQEDIRAVVTIAAPGADSNDYILFDSAAANPPIDLTSQGIDRITFALNNSQACTVTSRFLRAGTGGTTGVAAVYDTNQTTGLLAIGAGATGSSYDFATIGLGPMRIVLTNAGVAQANWPPLVTLVRGQKQSST